MSGLEEIQEIMNKFIDESKQIKLQISDIEKTRAKLAEKRNKYVNMSDCIDEVKTLGNEISELGNKSQKIQNKLDSEFCEIKREIYLKIDNLIAEGIRKNKKFEDEIQEFQDIVELQKGRKAKYELQKQAFYKRFGRVPELSEDAKIEDKAQDKQCIIYKQRIIKLKEKIKNIESEINTFAKIKREIKNKNFRNILEYVNEIEETPIIDELEIEEFVPVDDVKIDDLKVEEFKTVGNLNVEPLNIDNLKEETINDVSNENNILKYDDDIGKIAKAIVEEIVEQQTKESTIENSFDDSNAEIITFENTEDKEDEKEILHENNKIVQIIAKVENDEIVYKAQINNGDEIKVYPEKEELSGIVLNGKEQRKQIKDYLVNYSISTHKIFDKKIINKLDPNIYNVFIKFSNKYNIDAKDLIYSYAMSFSRKYENEGEEIPQITYNFLYIKDTNLTKKEEKYFEDICKNARENEFIYMIEKIKGFSKLKYMIKRIFKANKVNALPERKY